MEDELLDILNNKVNCGDYCVRIYFNHSMALEKVVKTKPIRFESNGYGGAIFGLSSLGVNNLSQYLNEHRFGEGQYDIIHNSINAGDRVLFISNPG